MVHNVFLPVFVSLIDLLCFPPFKLEIILDVVKHFKVLDLYFPRKPLKNKFLTFPKKVVKFVMVTKKELLNYILPLQTVFFFSSLKMTPTSMSLGK